MTAIEPNRIPKTPGAPEPQVPDQREDQPLKEINDPPRDQKQAGQDLRDPQERDNAE